MAKAKSIMIQGTMSNAGKSLLALKTTDVNDEEYSLWVYQYNSLEQAQAICKVLSTAFNTVLTSEKP